MTKILKCNCKNEYQDKKYGQNLRVHNKTQKKAGMTEFYFRCTVCTNTRLP